ncbi:MAG: Gfo/Idh/MocA family oxidoreductase [Caldilineaceae bacterium]|nr:Gfo/Idh/MocA family oxidoreductase [Caldilineaceae bacterium]
MSTNLRVGILGVGTAAAGHAHAYAQLPDVTINALWNRTKTKAETFAGKLNQSDLQIYDHWESLIENVEIDVLSITTGEFLRREPVVAALERGLHVLVEKPYSIALEDAIAMTAAAQHRNTISAISLNWRYAPGVQLAWRGLREGWIGHMLDIQQSWRFRGSPRSMQEWLPWATEEITLLAGGGSHEFDRARFLTGCEFVRLVGAVHTVTYSKEPEFIMPGAYSLVAELTGGLWGDFRLTITTGQPAWTLVVNGEEGTLEVAHDRVFLRQADDKEQRSIEVPVADQKPDGVPMIQHTWDQLIADFVKAIRKGDRSATPHLPTLTDALRGQEVIAAAELAAAEQRWVAIQEMR